MAKRLIPTINRVLIEKITAPAKTSAGILLPEKSAKVSNLENCNLLNVHLSCCCLVTLGRLSVKFRQDFYTQLKLN